MPQTDTRAQSETLGTILMIAVITASITFAGGAVTVNYFDQASTDKPLAELEIESEDGSNIDIRHTGGEALDMNNTVVIIDGLTLGTLGDIGSFDGNRDEVFSIGESITINPSASRGTIEVLVVDKTTNSIVKREEIILVDRQEGKLSVENFDAPEDAKQGETITVSADIVHSGDVELTQDVNFSVNGIQEDTEEITLEDGSQNVEFSYTVAEDEGADSITVEITTIDDGESAEVTVLDVGELTIENFDAPEDAEQGETITVSADIVHRGDVELTQDVTFNVNSNQVSSEEVTLGGGVQNVEFSYTVPEDEDADSITVEITTDDDEESVEIPVNAAPEVLYVSGSAGSSDGLFIDTNSVLNFEVESTYGAEIEITGFSTTGPAGAGGVERNGLFFGLLFAEEIVVDTEGGESVRDGYFSIGERADLGSIAVVGPESTASVTIREYTENQETSDRVDISGEELTITVYYNDPNGEEQTADLTFVVDNS